MKFSTLIFLMFFLTSSNSFAKAKVKTWQDVEVQYATDLKKYKSEKKGIEKAHSLLRSMITQRGQIEALQQEYEKSMKEFESLSRSKDEKTNGTNESNQISKLIRAKSRSLWECYVRHGNISQNSLRLILSLDKKGLTHIGIPGYGSTLQRCICSVMTKINFRTLNFDHPRKVTQTIAFKVKNRR